MVEQKRIINGTYGTLQLDYEEVAEVTGVQAKVNIDYTDVNIAGRLSVGKKMISWNGTGSLKMHKVNSRMGKKVGDALKQGKQVEFTIVSSLKDPDSYGYETVVVRNVLFTDLTLADWTVAQGGSIETSFVFSDFEYKNKI
ncbi:MAG TPA: phage portal protein [Clostridium sp.]|nr:phage portal protein [Clostridium sp.]